MKPQKYRIFRKGPQGGGYPDLGSERGVALITALLVSMVSLAMVLMTIYLVTQGTQVSGLYKRYQTALEAAYGGGDLMVREIIPKAIPLVNGGASLSSLGNYGGLIQGVVGDNCFNQKLTSSSNPASNWNNCNPNNLNPSDNADLTLRLTGQAQGDYDVFIKIVETKPGNSNTSGINLGSQGGVAESNLGFTAAPHYPMLYRIEIRAQKQSAPEERAELTILYEY